MATATRFAQLIVGIGLVGTATFGAPSGARADDDLHSVTASGAPIDDPFARSVPVGELDDGDVLDLRLDGFPAGEVGAARQCDESTCGLPYPIVFDADGRTRAQLQVRAAIGQQGCRRCTVTIEAHRIRARIDLWFGRPAPEPARVTVDPDVGVRPAQVVELRFEGLTGPTRLLLCPTDATSRVSCAPLTTPSDSTILRMDLEASGPATALARLPTEIDCSRRDPCAIVARADDRAVAVGVPIAFAAEPGVGYDRVRLLAGSSIALLLALVAVAVVRRTDWSPTGEVRAPEIDDAELADLDAIVARFEARSTPTG